jgi:hypothetical protein
MADAFRQDWDSMPYSYSGMSYSLASSVMTINTTSGDSIIHMGGLGSFSPTTYKYIEVRWRAASGVNVGGFQIFFYNATYGYATEAQVITSPDRIGTGNWVVTRMDMSTHNLWNTGGNVTGWRYDPSTAAAGITFEVDYIRLISNVAPNAPTVTLPASPTNDNTPTISWTFSDPDPGDWQGSYQVAYMISGAPDWTYTGWISSGANSWTAPALANGTWQFAVQTADSFGVGGSFGGYGSILIDTIAPVITSVSPQQYTASGATVRAWAYGVTDANGISYVSIYMVRPDGTYFPISNATRNGSTNDWYIDYTFPTTEQEGQWGIDFRAYDPAGNVSTVWTARTIYDKSIPALASAEVLNKDLNGYDVYAYGIYDAISGVNRVQFPTWTALNGQDDIQPNWQTNPVATGYKNLYTTTGFGIYNNYGVPASQSTLAETLNDKAVTRVSMTPDANSVGSFKVDLGSHGVYSTATYTLKANTKYVVSVYWRGVTYSDTEVGLTASNIGGWTVGPTVDAGGGWKRTSAYRDGTVTTDKNDYLYFSFRSASCVAGTPVVVDWVCPQLEYGTVAGQYMKDGSTVTADEILIEFGDTSISTSAPYGRDQYTRMGHIELMGADSVDYGLNTNGATWTASSTLSGSATYIGLTPQTTKTDQSHHMGTTGYKWYKWTSTTPRTIRSIKPYTGAMDAPFNQQDFPKTVKITMKNAGIIVSIKYFTFPYPTGSPAFGEASSAVTNIGGVTWKFRVNKADHLNETGLYNTHVYPFDYAGNTAVIQLNNISMYDGLATVTTQAATAITPVTATANGNITGYAGADATDYGHVWSTATGPTTAVTTKTSFGARNTTGAFTSSLTGLSVSTTYYIRSYVTTSYGTTYGNEVSFATPSGLATVTTSATTAITPTTATANGNVSTFNGGVVSQYGHVWSTATGPTTILATKTAQGTMASPASFTSSMSGLSANTLYYVRAYATTQYGTVYGSELSFTTQDGLVNFGASTATAIAGTTATLNGSTTSFDGGTVTQYGFVWGTSTAPTTALGTKTTKGAQASPASWSDNISGLAYNTTYYVRPYGTTSYGVSYGTEITFKTLTGLPTVTTNAVTVPGSNSSATTDVGNVTAFDGETNVTQHGHVWNTATAPTIVNSKTSLGTRSTTGAFTSTLTGLSPVTTYYVRAYATTPAGTSYGNEVSFTSNKNNQATPTLPAASSMTATSIVWTSTAGSQITCNGLTQASGSTWSGLSPNTTYTALAYMPSTTTLFQSPNTANASATTPYALPTVTTSTPTTIIDKINVGGDISYTGGGPLTQYGHVWDTVTAPTVALATKTAQGTRSTTGTFTAAITGLASNTTYYIRAYATNPSGTSYGNEVSILVTGRVAKLKQGDLYIVGEVNERMPVVRNGLISNYPFDGVVRKYIPGAVRYIRDWLNGSTANTGNHWVEIQALDNLGINVALNKTATPLAAGSANYPFTRVTDGSTDTTLYADGAVGMNYVTIDLGALYNINSIKVWHYYADSRSYSATKTEISDDGINWFSIFDSAIEGTYTETSTGRIYSLSSLGTTANPITNTSTTLMSSGIAVEEATTNLVPTPTIFSSGWTPYTNSNDGAFMTEFGVEGLNLINRRSWCGAYKGITLPATGTYTLSVWVKPIARTDASISITLYTSGGGIADTNVSASWAPDKIGQWQRLTMTRTYTTTAITLYLICYGGTNAAGFEITAQYTMPQIEQKTFATSFANGSRSGGRLDIPFKLVPPYTINLFHKPSVPLSLVVDQPTSPMIFQMNDYYSNASVSFWNFIKDLKVYTKGNASTAWTSTASYYTYTDTTWNNQEHMYTLIAVDNRVFKVYMDGVYLGTQTNSEDVTSITYLSIGNTSMPNATYRDLAIYNRALSDNEVKKLMDGELSITRDGTLLTDLLTEASGLDVMMRINRNKVSIKGQLVERQVL